MNDYAFVIEKIEMVEKIKNALGDACSEKNQLSSPEISEAVKQRWKKYIESYGTDSDTFRVLLGKSPNIFNFFRICKQEGRDEVLKKIKSFKKTWCADNCSATVCHGCDLHEVFIEIKKKFQKGGKGWGNEPKTDKLFH
jgi:hypothetical protein